MGKYQSIHTGAQIDDAVGKVANNEATNGQVLMANGGGGAEWKDLQKQNVGLDKVDNTSDMEKPVSNAQQVAINEVNLYLTQLRERVNALLDSDDTTLDQMSEIVAYIKANKSLIESVTTSKVNVSDIINNLTTNVANKPLSASQGVVLKGLVDALSNSKLNANELPTAINTALSQAKASGEFDGKDGKTPVKGVDYFTENDKQKIAEKAAALVDVDTSDFITKSTEEHQALSSSFGVKGSLSVESYDNQDERIDYGYDEIARHTGGTEYIYSLPEESGRIATIEWVQENAGGKIEWGEF